MQKFLRLCLWQVLIISISCFSLPISAEDGGIRIRGPKSTDAFPYDRYGPITGKDTLWNIALKVRPDPRLSVYQVMQALFENNPDSFKDSNLNHMVNGQYLKIPSIEIMRAISTENAQLKSRNDDKAWQEKVVKVVAKKVPAPEEASVNKKDLDAAKSEINVQLKAIDSTQQQRLATIQNDVLDSIDGLQSLLKENEALRQRLGSFNDQLDVMQSEVAKGKEIKVQMDDMIALQQALLAKAEAREQALLLEKQKADLEDDNFMSSTWFVVLMATLPAILVLSFIAMLLRRRSSKEGEVNVAPIKKDKVAEPEPKVAADAEPESLDNELSLDDDLSLDSELSLDDELSIDLSEGDDDLFSDDLDSLDDELLDDEVIQLDDDLDDLDDLEDISLDDDLETLALDEDIVESEALDGGQLDQSDLDSLFAGLEDEPSDDDDVIETLDSGVIGQNDLDSLLDEGSGSESTASDDAEVLNNPEDIDALLDAAGDDALEEPDELAADESSEVSDPDDIDALLDATSEEIDTPTVESNTAEDNADVSDPDDIDALLDSVNDNADVSDPDDIDALLDAVNDNADVSDPDDIDALLDSINDEADNAEVKDSAEDNVDVSDPDDIDALLDSINDTPNIADAISDDTSEDNSTPGELASGDVNDEDITTSDTSDNDNTALINNFSDEYVQSFIDADFSELLNEFVDEAEVIEPEASATLDSLNESTEDNDDDGTDDFDIDALIDEVNHSTESEVTESDVSETIDNPGESTEDKDDDGTDDFDIDALIDEVNHSPEAEVTESDVSKTIDNPGESTEDNDEDISDDFDIDALIDEVNHSPATDDEALDIGDDLLDTELLDSELDSDNTDVQQEKEADDFVDEETLSALSGDFDESTLAQLLNDEKEVDSMVELSPDFTDSNVLADLLAEDSNTNNTVKDDVKSNAEEVAGIKELDNLDFDDLLANIEEESSSVNNDDFELGDDFEVGDEFELDTSEDTELEEDNSATDNSDRDFVSVDSLLSDSLLDGSPTEPYEKMNVDVGLGEFPEFAGNITEEDIDDDDNGVAAKLDLAKVYLEIGDSENAEVILLDVVKQGDAQQQFDAQQLLDNLT